MHVHEKWSTELGSCAQPVWSLACYESQEVMLAPIGDQLALIDRSYGGLKTRLKAHKSQILAVTYSSDGKKIASSDRHGLVVIWKSTGEGLVKYAHGSAVRSVAFDPLSHILASGSDSEIGLWFPEKKTVEKIKTDTSVWTLKWSHSQLLVAGFADGSVASYDRSGSKIWTWKTEEALSSLCWCIDIYGDQVIAGLWDLAHIDEGGTLGFLNVETGDSFATSIRIESQQPTSVSWISSHLAVVGTTRGAIAVVSPINGVVTTLLKVEVGSWITCLALIANNLFYGTYAGRVACMHLSSPTVHAVHKGLYAARDNDTLTNIILLAPSNLVNRIVTSHVITKIALFSDKIVIEANNASISVYSLKDGSRISQFTSTSTSYFLALSELHIILFPEPDTVRSYSYAGREDKQWRLSASVRTAKVVDGPPGRESVFTGLTDGYISAIYLGNTTEPVQILKHSCGIRSFDTNLFKSHIGVIDDISVLSLYSIHNSNLLFSIPQMTSLSFNSSHAFLLAFTDISGQLSILDLRAPDLACRQSLYGTVISFRNDHVSCIHDGNILPAVPVNTTEIALKHLENNEFNAAFSVIFKTAEPATLQKLVQACLKSGNVQLARKSLARIGAYKEILKITL